MKLLYISWGAPYDKVRHAGGNTFNYYIKETARVGMDVTLVTFCLENEEALLDTAQCGIHTIPVVRHKNLKDFLNNAVSIPSKLDPRHRYCNLISEKSARMIFRALRQLADSGYKPDVIELEWTEMLLLIDGVKKLFPNAKIMASEHDVSFQRIQREAETERTRRKKIQAENTKSRELEAISKCDKVIVHSLKDRTLLTDAGVNTEKIFTIVPYYHRSLSLYKRQNDKILFFGNMYRMENKEAADWFNDNVMPLLNGTGCSFEVLGNGARYVESIDEEFSKALCFVCPVIHGAGIKVKNLEAMYAGIPVLTGNVGIEGIPAVDGKDYIHCETPEDYKHGVLSLMDGSVSIDGSRLIADNFDMEKSFRNYLDMVRHLS